MLDLDNKQDNYFQGLIGIVRWMCELGRVDILVPVAMLSRYLAATREGHLNQVFHILAYLKQYNRWTMVFDDTVPQFDESRFAKYEWAEFYPGAYASQCHLLRPNFGDEVSQCRASLMQTTQGVV